MIVKVQMPIVGDMALVYTKDRKEFHKQIPITDKLRAKMNGRLKVFFSAHRENGELVLDKEKRDLNW